MKRKVFILSSILFIIVATLGAMFLTQNRVEATTAVDENGITWDFTVNGQYIDYLRYSSGTIPDDGKIIIPSKLVVAGQEYEVRSLGNSSYNNNSSMFYSASYTNRNKIKEIIIPDTVNSVYRCAFYALSNLTTIDWGKGVTSIGDYVIASTNVSELYLPNSLASASYSTFSNYNSSYNYKIRKISVGDKLEGSTLTGDYSITRYTPNVTEWAVNEESEKYTVIDGEIYSENGTKLIAIKPNYNPSTYTVRDGVTKIGRNVFSGKSALTSVVLNDDITEIGMEAFYYCTGLTSIDLPDSLLHIGSYAFNNCYNLRGELKLPEGLTTIDSDAFYNCRGFTGDLIIPDSVTSIGRSAFQSCTGFDGQLIIGDGLTTIEYYTFYNDNNFSRVTIGSGVRLINRDAFDRLGDFWINSLEGEVTLENGFARYGNPYPHYLNCTHRVTIGTSEGIRVINTETNTEVLSGHYECETAFNYKVTIDPGYNYNDLKIVVIDNNDYDNAVTYDYVPGQEYEFSTLLRDRKIFIETIKEGYDLSLRTFVTDVNYTTVSKPRIPFAELSQGEFTYTHTKNPLRVENNDDVTFKVRVYNESLSKVSADEITVYIPEGMEMDPENVINSKNGWTLVSDRVAKTTNLEGKLINGYYGNGILSYKDLDIVLKVTDETSDEENYKTVFAEITRESTTDADSTPGNVVVSQRYMLDEILDSNANSAIVSQEDDDDFDTVVLNAKIRVQYNIRINKIDSKTDEVLKGAKFKLTSYGTNELEVTENDAKVLKTFNDGDTIATAVSDENGIVDFGGITSYGEGENEYLVEEIDAPSGYLTNIGKKMKVRVVKEIFDKEKGTYGVKVFCGSTDYAIDTSTYEFTPVKTAEQLAKIGSGETVNVDGMDYEYNIDTNYKLIDDIDLSGIDWTPIRNEIKGVFDGNGHKISNLTIVADGLLPYSEVGLISTFSGIVENLTFENPNIHIGTFDENAVSNSGYTGVGCFAGTMRQGGIYNCKTTQTEGASASITASVDNIGGLVGHTVPEGLVTVIDCENNISIVGQETIIEGKTYTSANVGGVIGCALGSISVQDSTNNGYVQAENYNAGGLVGFVKPSDYREMLLSAGYDEDNKRIDLLVENQAAEGQYNLTLEVRDRKTQDLIGGATYEIDKVEDVVMTQLLDTGSLKLFDKVIEYSGRDVYFLTEDETIEGYSKLNGIIKVVIERYWDNDTNEYKVRAEATIVSHKEYEEFIEERETNDNDVRGEEFDRGSVFTDANIVNANWNGSKVEFTNCVNNATIQSMYMNAAGILGTSYGLVEFENCTNNGQILSPTKAGGMVAELRSVNESAWNGTIETQNTTSNSRFTGCVNNGKVYAIGDSVGSVAGILSELRGYAIIENAVNNGEVMSTKYRQVGGIAGQVHGGIEIKDSTNNGQVFSYGGGVDTECGGILGHLRNYSSHQEKTPYKNTYARITGCKNNGDVTGGCATGGIVGLTSGNEITITNCELVGTAEKPIKITVFSDGAYGGILGLDSCKHTTVKDCKVEYAELEITCMGSTYAGAGGIVGNIDHYAGPHDTASGENTTIDSIVLNNNTVKNTKIINRGKEAGGILGPLNLGDNSKCWTSINNCSVEDTEILHLHTGGSQTYNTIAGICALAGFGNGNVEINYCIVDNCSLIHQNPEGGIGPGMSSIGGIAGKGNEVESLSIKNCDLKDTFIHDYAYDSTSGSPGGILGMIYSVRKDVTISGCNVINSTIKEYGQNVGGIIGGLQAVSGKLTVEDCNMIETNVSRDIPGDYSTTYNCVGYVAGYLASINGVEISNINILGKDLPKGAEGRTTIQSDGANIGAVVGNVQSCSYFTADNINVKNIDIINTVGMNGTPSLDATQIGGFAGLLYSDKHELNNITIDNCDIKGYKCFDVGGVAATMFSSNNLLKNVKVVNTNITTEVKPEDGVSSYGHAAGLIGAQMSGATYEDCLVENCKITCGCIGAAGIVSHSSGTTLVKDCTVRNIELIDTWENLQGEQVVTVMSYGYQSEFPYQQYRPYGGVAATANGTLEANNVVVDGIKCHAKYAHIGGIAGYASTAKINNCTVKNANFYSERNISPVNGAVAGIIADGYNVSEFTNNKVQDSTITTTTHLLGGLIGYLHNPTTISGCEVDNVELTHKNKDHYSQITEYYTDVKGPSMGGVVAETDAALEIKNTTIKNSTLKAENPDSISLQLGGVLGYSPKDDEVKVTLDKVNVINTEIENETTGSATGGLIGMSWGTTIKNSAVKENSKVTGKGHTAGFVGLGSLDVTDSKLLNTTITSAGSETAAGIIAIGNQSDANWNPLPSSIDGVEVKDTVITGSTESGIWNNHAAGVAAVYSGTIEDVTMSNVDITAGSVVAGVIAIQSNDEEIKDIVLNDVNSTSANSHAGGVAGIVYGKISNAKISNSEVKANQMAGGILVTNNGSPSVENVEVNNVKVTSSNGLAGGVIVCTYYPITEATVKNSTITANGMAAGISVTNYGGINTATVEGTTVKSETFHAAGITTCSYALVKNVNVKDSSVTGKVLSGGVVAAANAEINTATVKETTVKSETLHAGGVVACTQSPVTGSSVKGSTIITLTGAYASGDGTNPTCLGGLVGAGIQDSTTGELKPDLSTSTVENNTLTGATGTLVGKYIGAPTALNEQMVAAEPVSNTNSLTGSQAPLNTQAAPMQTMSAPLQTTSAPTTQSATNDAEEPEVTNSDETTNSEPTTSTTNEEETSTESTEESTPSTTTTDSETDTTSSSDKTEEASTTEGND